MKPCKSDSLKSFWAVFSVLLVVAVQLQVPSAVTFAQVQEFGPFPDDTAIFVDVDNTTGIEDGSQDYPFNTIQEGINAATTGDVVGVAPGKYTENLTLAAGVQLCSTEADTTIIDGGGSGTVLLMKGASVLDGFTVQNGAATSGAGITIMARSAPIISNNVIRHNHGFFGAAIFGDCSSPRILGNRIVGNIADEQGASGIVVFSNCSSPLIANNVLRNNRGRGAINLTVPARNAPTVVNNTIVDNNGAGIRIHAALDESVITVANNILFGNKTGLELEHISIGFPSFVNNNVFGNATDYDGISDQTGIRGNISADPLFLDTAGVEFHLGPASPCIDAGSNDAPNLPSYDYEGDVRIVDGNGDGVAIVDIGMDEFVFGGPFVEVEIDVRPDSDQNIINLGSGGVVAVAILTTGEFDTNTVKPASVIFAGTASRRWAMEDVDRDGDLDLNLYFEIQELVLDESSTEATLTGVTFPYAGGVLIEGTDTVRIIP